MPKQNYRSLSLEDGKETPNTGKPSKKYQKRKEQRQPRKQSVPNSQMMAKRTPLASLREPDKTVHDDTGRPWKLEEAMFGGFA